MVEKVLGKEKSGSQRIPQLGFLIQFVFSSAGQLFPLQFKHLVGIKYGGPLPPSSFFNEATLGPSLASFALLSTRCSNLRYDYLHSSSVTVAYIALIIKGIIAF